MTAQRYAVANGDGRHVAVGEQGALFTKDADADWVLRDSGIAAWLYGAPTARTASWRWEEAA